MRGVIKAKTGIEAIEAAAERGIYCIPIRQPNSFTNEWYCNFGESVSMSVLNDWFNEEDNADTLLFYSDGEFSLEGRSNL